MGESTNYLRQDLRFPDRCSLSIALYLVWRELEDNIKSGDPSLVCELRRVYDDLHMQLFFQGQHGIGNDQSLERKETEGAAHASALQKEFDRLKACVDLLAGIVHRSTGADVRAD
ncbi:MAG: hypothetical protein FWF41_05395 [Betaproteobacteria bacterium]|nr:hypothetical protein [Betaproteobacteria bacterium]